METIDRLRILMVEEEGEEVLLVRKMLGDCRKFTWRLDWAPDYPAALERLVQDRYDLLLVDSVLGARSGLDLLEEPAVVQSGAGVIVFSARGDYDNDLAAMAAGAMDYLVKGQFDSVMLERSIRYAVSLKRSREELVLAGARLERMVEQRTRGLEKERTLLQAILGQMPIGVIISDPEGRLVLANEQAERIARCSMASMGRVEECLDGCTRADGNPLDRDEWPLTRSLGSGELVTDLELCLDRREGDRTALSVSSVPVRDSGGKIIAGVLMLMDVTERKQSEEELLSIRADLEERVRERTLELEGASRAKDEFLANMSHEIRTPMSGILGMTEMLLQRELPPEVRSDLSIIRESTGSVLTLLNDLLDLSRIEQGGVELHPVDFDLYCLIDGLVRPFELQAMEKGLTFGVFLDQDLPRRVFGDPDRLGQVIKNLLSNAVKFTEEGGVRLRVRNNSGSGNGVKLCFSVADTGVGIAKTKHNLLFQPFSQLEPTLSKRHGGSGLGLAITRKLVRLMGGDIQVESRKGGGATFSFRITLRRSKDVADSTAIVPLTLSDLPQLTFLLAEDNTVNRLFLNRALLRAGHKVVEAENGKEALDKLSSSRVDCVLMDVQMPVMDGLQATRKIRRTKADNLDGNVPIIALTAYAMKGDREKFLNAGMDGYVSKPVDFDDLARAILQAIGERRACNAPLAG